MDLTELNRRWLDQRFLRARDGSYFAHEPIYGLEGREYSEPNPVLRYARIFQVLRFLNRMMPFQSLLDVGGAEGYVSHLVRKIFGARVVNFDLSKEANHRAREIFGLDGVSGVSHELPFKTGAFDVVLCIEVIEHLEGPLQTILELDRVSLEHLLVSSVNFSLSQDDRRKRLAARRFGFHFDRNRFLEKDFEILLGSENLIAVDQYRNYNLDDLNGIGDIQEACQAVLRICPPDGVTTDAQIVVKSKIGTLAQNGILPEEQLVNAIMEDKVQPREILFRPPENLSDDLLVVLCCPDCRIQSGAEVRLTMGMEAKTRYLVCEGNLHRYPIEDGLPLLYPLRGLVPRPLYTLLDNTRYDSQDLRYLSDLEIDFHMPGNIIGSIDEPLANSTVRGNAQVRGWVLDLGSRLRLHVEAIVDGKPAGSTKNDIPREDILDHFWKLGVSVPRENGFILFLDAKTLTPGAHDLRVLARSASGEVVELGQIEFQSSIQD